VGAQRQAAERLGADSTGAVPTGGALRQRILGQLSGATRYFFPFLSSTLAVAAGVLLVIFLAIYVAVEPRTYHDGLMHLFPHEARPRAGEVLTAIATVLRRWLVTQLIAMLVIGTVTTVVLLLLDVPAAFPLGVMAGLLEFIPTIGPILSAVPAIAMGFVDSPEKALYVTIAYWGIQFLENQLLIPLLMREGVDIPPALTIIAQAVMALVFGFLGLLVAVPMLAAGMVAVKMLYVEGVVGDDIDVMDAGDGKD
jgi:predicted PurR-regulated permease PerM